MQERLQRLYCRELGFLYYESMAPSSAAISSLACTKTTITKDALTLLRECSQNPNRTYVYISVADPGYLSRIPDPNFFIPDPNFFYPGSRIRIFSIPNPDPEFYPSRTPDPQHWYLLGYWDCFLALHWTDAGGI